MFCKELYLDEYTAGNLKTIRRKIRHGKYMPGIYVLMLSKKDGTLEYMNSAYLAQKYYKKNPPFIIGLAKSQESMLHMIQSIFEEVCLLTHANFTRLSHKYHRIPGVRKSYSRAIPLPIHHLIFILYG